MPLVQLWMAPEPETIPAPTLAAWERLLSPDERLRWQRFLRETDRRRFLLARALTRTVLGELVGIAPAELVFTQGPFGKPCLSSSSAGSATLHFNLSHTHGLVVLAVSAAAELGIDVEVVQRNVELLPLARRYFSSTEVGQLEALEGEKQRELFFALWTLKEAWVKAKGLGLRVPLDEFWFEFAGSPGGKDSIALFCEPQLQENPDEWRFWSFLSGDHRIALAVHSGSTHSWRVEEKYWMQERA
jgi:4'-phosphopantetheinyl transferase